MKDLSTVFTIKPLEWNTNKVAPFDFFIADTPFGYYAITRIDEDIVEWGYCFDEYYDEDRFTVSSIEEAKEAALKHWIKRVSDALIVQSDEKDGDGLLGRIEEYETIDQDIRINQ